MRKSSYNETRLQSAVQFKCQDMKHLSSFTRLQTGTTTSRIQDDVTKTQASEQRTHRMFRRVSSQISLAKEDSQLRSAERTPQRLSQKLIVTSDNLQSSEIKRRMKFDPVIRHQVSLIKIKCMKNIPAKRFLLFLLSKEKTVFDMLRMKQIPPVIDILQSIIEMAIGTKNSLLMVEVLLFVADLLENVGQIEMSIHFYNQVRILSSFAKFDLQKMRALIGLANCSIGSHQYEEAIRFLKKCLQYSWYNNNPDYENLAYQKMGIAYFYLGNIEKSIFYHERSINYDYELEGSPLRQLSCDTLKNYLSKNYPNNYANNYNLLMSKVSLKMPVNIELFAEELLKNMEFAPSPRLFLNSQECSRRMSMAVRELANLKLDGLKLIRDILNQQEFDFEVYTPKHSFRTESKCFDHLHDKKVHPQEVFHDPKYKANPFVIDDLGVQPNKNTLNFAEYLSKYKLSLEKKVEIRLKQNFKVNIEQKLQWAARTKIEKWKEEIKFWYSSRISQLTHRNQENIKKNKQLVETKQLADANVLFQNLVSKLLQVDVKS